MTRSNFIEILMILTKYVFDLGVRLTEFSVTVESVGWNMHVTCTLFRIGYVYMGFTIELTYSKQWAECNTLTGMAPGGTRGPFYFFVAPPPGSVIV